MIKVSPIAAAMYIPGCNSGKLYPNRGGSGGTCERNGQCRTDYQVFRACTNTALIVFYDSHDIVMSEEINSCDQIYKTEWADDNYSHDAVIVGHARDTIYEYWLVR